MSDQALAQSALPIPEPATPVSRTLVSDQARQVEIRPGRIASLALAPGATHSDTTVFLVHGAGGNQDQWREVWNELVQAGYRVLAFDFVGHGHSPKPRQAGTYRGTALVDDLRSILTTHGSRRNVVVAHSYGARLALGALLRLHDEGRADLVERAVLLGAQSPDASFEPGPIGALPAFALEWLRPKLSRQFRAVAWSAQTDPALVEYEAGLADRNPMHVFKSLVTQGFSPEAASLSGLALPVLVLAGDHDGLTPAAGARALVDRLPCAELRVFEHCGHQIMLEQAVLTSRAILGFIAAQTVA